MTKQEIIVLFSVVSIVFVITFVIAFFDSYRGK